MELSEERRHGAITERVLQASAASYVVSPAAVSGSAADPDANGAGSPKAFPAAEPGATVRRKWAQDSSRGHRPSRMEELMR